MTMFLDGMTAWPRRIRQFACIAIFSFASVAIADGMPPGPAEPAAARCTAPPPRKAPVVPRPTITSQVNIDIACSPPSPPVKPSEGPPTPPKPTAPASADEACAAAQKAAIDLDAKVWAAREPTRQEWLERLLFAFVMLTVLGLLLVLFMQSNRGAIGMSSHWGGFGSSGGGWEVSAALGGALVVAALAVVLLAVCWRLVDQPVAQTLVTLQSGTTACAKSRTP